MADSGLTVDELEEDLSTIQIVDEIVDESEDSSTDSEICTSDLETSSLSQVSMSTDISYYILDWRSRATPSTVSYISH